MTMRTAEDAAKKPSLQERMRADFLPPPAKPQIAPLHLVPYRVTFPLEVESAKVFVQWDCLLNGGESRIRCRDIVLGSGVHYGIWNPIDLRYESELTSPFDVEWRNGTPRSIAELLERLPPELTVVRTRSRSKDIQQSLKIRLPHATHELEE